MDETSHRRCYSAKNHPDASVDQRDLILSYCLLLQMQALQYLINGIPNYVSSLCVIVTKYSTETVLKRKVYFGSWFQRDFTPLWQDRQGEFILWKVFTKTPHITEVQEGQKRWKARCRGEYNFQRPSPRELLLPVRLHVLNVPQPSRQNPSRGTNHSNSEPRRCISDLNNNNIVTKMPDIKEKAKNSIRG